MYLPRKGAWCTVKSNLKIAIDKGCPTALKCAARGAVGIVAGSRCSQHKGGKSGCDKSKFELHDELRVESKELST